MLFLSLVFVCIAAYQVWLIREKLKAKRSRKQAMEALEKRRMKLEMYRLEAEQQRQAMEQEQIRQEQERQAIQLAKHEEQIAKLTFKLKEAEADIENQNIRLNQLYALLDIAEANQAASVPGSKQDIRYQKQIITLNSQIATTEKRIRKAEFEKQTAEKKLAA